MPHQPLLLNPYGFRIVGVFYMLGVIFLAELLDSLNILTHLSLGCICPFFITLWREMYRPPVTCQLALCVFYDALAA